MSEGAIQSLATQWNGRSFPVSAQALTDIVNVDGTRTPAYGSQYRRPRFKLLQSGLAPASSGGGRFHTDHMIATGTLDQLQPVITGTYGPLGDDGDVTAYVTGAQIVNDTSRPVHREIRIDFRESSAFIFNPLQHLVQVFADYYSDGSFTTFLGEIPMGIFSFILPDRELADAGNVWHCSGLDLTSWINQLVFFNTWAVAKGANVVTTIVNLLTQDFLPLSQNGSGQTPAGLDHCGPNIPLSRISIPDPGAVMPSQFVFSRGDNQLAAINSLLRAINYYDLWVDSSGVFQSGPIPNYSVSVPPAGWTYATGGPAATIINGSVKETFSDQSKIYNAILVYSEPTGSGTTPISATYYNNDSTRSRIGLQQIQRAIPLVIRDDKIPDQATCTNYAYLEGQISATLNELLQFDTLVNPFHESHEHLSITINDPSGNLLAGSDLGYEEVSWSMDLGSWKMGHSVGKAIAV